MKSKIRRCECRHPKLAFKLYRFEGGRRNNYKGTCLTCGYVRGWYAAANYRLIESVASNSQQKGG